MNPLNHDGTQKVCFSMRETGICVREARGETCGMLHLDFAAVKECTDSDYVTGPDHRCSNVWKCLSKHPKDRKTRALKATKAAGNMLRSIDVDKFQGGQPAVAGDSSDDSSATHGCPALWEVDRAGLSAEQRSDLATFEEDYYDAPQYPVPNKSLPGCDLLVAGNRNGDGQAPVASASVCDSQNSARPGSGTGTGSGLQHPDVANETCHPGATPPLRASNRPNFGVPAELYIDTTDYADRMLEDVPADEFAAAVLEPVDDAEIRGSESGSNTEATDQTYSGGSASVSDGYSSDGICELEERLGAVDLGDSSSSGPEDVVPDLSLSTSNSSELGAHSAAYQPGFDMAVDEMDRMRISQSEIPLRAREIPKADQSEISLRAREIPLIDQPAASAVDCGTCGLESDDSDDQLGQDSPKKDFNEKNENSDFLGAPVKIPENVTCEPVFVDGGTCGLKSDDSGDQFGQDSPKKDFNEKNENSNFLGAPVKVPGKVTCEPAFVDGGFFRANHFY